MQLLAPTTAATATSDEIELFYKHLNLPQLTFCFRRTGSGAIQIQGRNHPSHPWVNNGPAQNSEGVFTRPPTRYVRAQLTAGSGTCSLDVFF